MSHHKETLPHCEQVEDGATSGHIPDHFHYFDVVRMEPADITGLVRSLQEVIRDLTTAKEELAKAHEENKVLTAKLNVLTSCYEKMDAQTQTDGAEIDSLWGGGGELESGEIANSLAENIRDTATSAMHDSGIVYDQQSGLYFDSTTGYYYNQNRTLSYDPYSGDYYVLDAGTGEYVFHCRIKPRQVLPSSGDNSSSSEEDPVEFCSGEVPLRCKTKPGRNHIKKSVKSRAKLYRRKEACTAELGEGIIDEEEREDGEIDSESSEDSDVAVWHPPCLRCVVLSSEVVDVGHLVVVTQDGAKFGSQPECDFVLNEKNIGTVHCCISFNMNWKRFFIQDSKADEAIFLNGTPFSEVKMTDSVLTLGHGDQLKMGSTLFLLHIHGGSDSCGECHPALIKKNLEAPAGEKSTSSSSSSQDQRVETVKNIKRKYGLLHSRGQYQLKDQYKDKAEQRRQTVGSDNPYQKPAVKGGASSIAVAIQASNKGHQMMSKMGWKEGQTLGKDSQNGLLEPVEAFVRADSSAGLGSTSSPRVSLDEDLSSVQKFQRKIANQKRFLQLQEKVDGTFSTNSELESCRTNRATNQGETSFSRKNFVKGKTLNET